MKANTHLSKNYKLDKQRIVSAFLSTAIYRFARLPGWPETRARSVNRFCLREQEGQIQVKRQDSPNGKKVEYWLCVVLSDLQNPSGAFVIALIRSDGTDPFSQLARYLPFVSICIANLQLLKDPIVAFVNQVDYSHSL